MEARAKVQEVKGAWVVVPRTGLCLGVEFFLSAKGKVGGHVRRGCDLGQHGGDVVGTSA